MIRSYYGHFHKVHYFMLRNRSCGEHDPVYAASDQSSMLCNVKARKTHANNRPKDLLRGFEYIDDGVVCVYLVVVYI